MSATATWRDVLEGRARWAVECADNAEILPAIPGGVIQHVITDPPYSNAVHSRQWQAAALGRPTPHSSINFDPITPEVMAATAAQAARLASRWSLFFTDVESVLLWMREVETAGLDYVRTCIWVKPDATPQFTGDRPASGAEAAVIAHQPGRKRWNGGGKRNVYTHTREGGGSEHPTTKPLTLMLELLADFTDPEEIILDPFAGSGTTGVAALRLGRRFIGIERDPKYAAIARERLAAESQGLTLRDARAGQLSLLGGG